MGSEYDLVELRPRWGGLSLGFFVLTLLCDYLIRFLPWRVGPMGRPQLYVLVGLLLSLCGVLTGWVGLRRSPSKRMARAGLLLNAVALLLLLLATAAGLWIWYGR